MNMSFFRPSSSFFPSASATNLNTKSRSTQLPQTQTDNKIAQSCSNISTPYSKLQHSNSDEEDEDELQSDINVSSKLRQKSGSNNENQVASSFHKDEENVVPLSNGKRQLSYSNHQLPTLEQLTEKKQQRYENINLNIETNSLSITGKGKNNDSSVVDRRDSNISVTGTYYATPTNSTCSTSTKHQTLVYLTGQRSHKKSIVSQASFRQSKQYPSLPIPREPSISRQPLSTICSNKTGSTGSSTALLLQYNKKASVQGQQKGRSQSSIEGAMTRRPPQKTTIVNSRRSLNDMPFTTAALPLKQQRRTSLSGTTNSVLERLSCKGVAQRIMKAAQSPRSAIPEVYCTTPELVSPLTCDNDSSKTSTPNMNRYLPSSAPCINTPNYCDSSHDDSGDDDNQSFKTSVIDLTNSQANTQTTTTQKEHSIKVPIKVENDSDSMKVAGSRIDESPLLRIGTISIDTTSSYTGTSIDDQQQQRTTKVNSNRYSASLKVDSIASKDVTDYIESDLNVDNHSKAATLRNDKRSLQPTDLRSVDQTSLSISHNEDAYKYMVGDSATPNPKQSYVKSKLHGEATGDLSARSNEQTPDCVESVHDKSVDLLNLSSSSDSTNSELHNSTTFCEPHLSDAIVQHSNNINVLPIKSCTLECLLDKESWSEEKIVENIVPNCETYDTASTVDYLPTAELCPTQLEDVKTLDIKQQSPPDNEVKRTYRVEDECPQLELAMQELEEFDWKSEMISPARPIVLERRRTEAADIFLPLPFREVHNSEANHSSECSEYSSVPPLDTPKSSDVTDNSFDWRLELASPIVTRRNNDSINSHSISQQIPSHELGKCLPIEDNASNNSGPHITECKTLLNLLSSSPPSPEKVGISHGDNCEENDDVEEIQNMNHTCEDYSIDEFNAPIPVVRFEGKTLLHTIQEDSYNAGTLTADDFNRLLLEVRKLQEQNYDLRKSHDDRINPFREFLDEKRKLQKDKILFEEEQKERENRLSETEQHMARAVHISIEKVKFLQGKISVISKERDLLRSELEEANATIKRLLDGPNCNEI